MVHETEGILDLLINSISDIKEVQAIGISGGKSTLPKSGEGDIDIFIYCDSIPEVEKRRAALNQLGSLLQDSKFYVFEGGHWGVGDFTLINGVETWLMYFTESVTEGDIDSILKVEYPDKLDNYYYPIGRCAMLKSINILYDKDGFLNSLKDRLAEYPESLAVKLVEYHLDELEDIEDLERAASRKDVLFYHFALDLAIDHFLQALFAMNRTYFPSRKRTLQFISDFDVKPEQCNERLLEVIKLGGNPEDVPDSYSLWIDLVAELWTLRNEKFN